MARDVNGDAVVYFDPLQIGSIGVGVGSSGETLSSCTSHAVIEIGFRDNDAENTKNVSIPKKEAGNEVIAASRR